MAFSVKDQCKDKNPRWNNGKAKHTLGYIWIASPDHPFKDKRGYVLEHRLVMERSLGRILQPNEIVHHINGIVFDNRIENLMLFSRQGHSRYHLKLRGGKIKGSGKKNIGGD